MNETSETPGAGRADSDPRRGRRRRLGLTLLTAVVLLAGGGFGVWEWLWAGDDESTDNAYVQGNIVQITPQAGGTVVAIHAGDTDFVRAGQPLVQLDPADAKVALDQAEAALAQAVRQVRTWYANNHALEAQVALRQADVARAQADLARARDDLTRRQSLSGQGAVSKEEVQHARSQHSSAGSALAAAQAGVAAAREQLASNRAMTEGTSVERHPAVQQAVAKVHEAWLAWKRTTLPAPVDGHVARRAVQLGQRVAAGAPLMSLIPLEQVWVDANFKEGQLASIRIGQPVMVTADVYGGKVEYRGTVAGLGAGTGAAFALLPAQNATGNWIKVVQRVPVRIELDARQLKEHPLRIGLSMNATVDVRDRSGRMLAAGSRERASRTQVYSQQDDGVEREVARVIAAAGGVALAATQNPGPAVASSHPMPDLRGH